MGHNPGGQSSDDGQAVQSGQQTQTSQQNQPAQGTQQNQPAQGTQQPQADQQGQPANGNQPNQHTGSQQPDAEKEVASWFTETIVRTVVAVFGAALLLLALGQLAGVNLLGAVGDFLASSVGVWLVVAFFATLLIVAAGKSWNFTR